MTFGFFLKPRRKLSGHFKMIFSFNRTISSETPRVWSLLASYLLLQLDTTRKTLDEETVKPLTSWFPSLIWLREIELRVNAKYFSSNISLFSVPILSLSVWKLQTVYILNTAYFSYAIITILYSFFATYIMFKRMFVHLTVLYNTTHGVVFVHYWTDFHVEFAKCVKLWWEGFS